MAAALPAPAFGFAKVIWGPPARGGASQFPIYHDLHASIYQTGISWASVAPRRPANPTSPSDPAYRWPAYLDYVVGQASQSGIRVALTVTQTPGWANGGRPPEWAPNQAQDYANFLQAAARRYGSVHLWMIWGEPSRSLLPMPFNSPVGPQRYAILLDAAYGALKSVSPANLVIGGNTFTTGVRVAPLRFINWMRLPNGRRPRLDLYGHNPFVNRRPRLANPPLGRGFADFSDLDQLARVLDRAYPGRHIPLYLSEFTLPTDRPGRVFGFAVQERTAASWLSSAFAIARRWSRIYALGWYTLYDEPPGLAGHEDWGLLTYSGRRKPAYFVYQRG